MPRFGGGISMKSYGGTSKWGATCQPRSSQAKTEQPEVGQLSVEFLFILCYSLHFTLANGHLLSSDQPRDPFPARTRL